MARRPVGRATFPDKGRPDQRITVGKRLRHELYDTVSTSSHYFQSRYELVEQLLQDWVRLERAIACPRGSNDESIYEAVTITIVGSNENMLVPP